jgi:hypothetical protein
MHGKVLPCTDFPVLLMLMYLMFVARDLLKIFRWSEITGSRVRDPMAVIDQSNTSEGICVIERPPCRMPPKNGGKHQSLEAHAPARIPSHRLLLSSYRLKFL